MIGGGYERFTDIRMARNQRDAGIEHLEWEGRLKPLTPLYYDVIAGIGVAVSLIVIASMFT